MPFARVTAFAIGWTTGTELVASSTLKATPGTGWPVVAFTTCPVTVGRMLVGQPPHPSSINMHGIALQPDMATLDRRHALYAASLIFGKRVRWRGT